VTTLKIFTGSSSILKIKINEIHRALAHPNWGGGCRTAAVPQRNLQNAGFVDTMISKVVRDLRFSLNQPWKSADDWYIGLLKNTIKIYEYVDTFFLFLLVLIVSCNINSISARRFWYEFHKIVFKIKKLYITLGSARHPPPPKKKFWMCQWRALYIQNIQKRLSSKIYVGMGILKLHRHEKSFSFYIFF
jgi:hypothetical protein